MTEYSYPVVNQPLPANQWTSVTKGIGNGIIDEGSGPYQLSNWSNADNTAVMKCPTAVNKQYGHAILEGFYHRYDADITLSFPAVTSTRRYMVVLQYDPSNETKPVALKVLTSLDYTQGKNYIHLYNVDREPNQLLTDATVRSLRPRVSPVQVYGAYDRLPLAWKVLWGTVAVVHNDVTTNSVQMYISVSSGSSAADEDRYWKLIYDQAEPSWLSVNDYENSVGGTESGYPKEILRDGSTRKMHGRIRRQDGSQYSAASGAGYLVATLGASDTPRLAISYPVRCGGGTDGVLARGNVVIRRSSSEVRLYIDQGSCAWVDLGTLEWDVR
ncbi:hypothetical protein [Brachybacterium subflavum]|uniref:hypothetical protein n=1 Tax=Brachybacterium subflavum TaxID=2585206 RepID=UPI0012665F4E|nr:hypothetical protein [Brachybacterium subflavum]